MHLDHEQQDQIERAQAAGPDAVGGSIGPIAAGWASMP